MKIRTFALLLLMLSLVFAFSCENNNDSFIKDDGPNYDYSDNDNYTTNIDTEIIDTETNIEDNLDTDSDKLSDINTDADSEIDTEIDADTETDTDTDSDVEEFDPLVGTQFTTEKGLRLVIIKGRTLSVAGYEGNISDINIPREYNGYIVTQIGEYAFSGLGDKAAEYENMLGFLTIFIPDTVKVIKKGAFLNCNDIKPYYDPYKNETPTSEWLSNLIIEDENKHVEDVLKEQRPAIGWGKFFIP